MLNYLCDDIICRVPSVTKLSEYIGKIAVTCLCSLLIACDPLIFGGISGLGESSGEPSSFAVAQCSSGPADLSGVCRNTQALTMGALEAVGSQLEAVGSQVVSADASLGIIAAPLQISNGSVVDTLNISWSPYPESVSGYLVYYGSTPETATTLASDLPNGTSNFDASAPSISYQPLLDLGLNSGATVCFRILAYDTAHAPYDWAGVQCTVV